jgi:CheY-like chemotaxis protein
VIVSDIGLPDKTGYDLMREIKSRYPTKGIAMSGYGMDEDLRRSREAGFSDHIVKPANAAQLERSIRRLAGDV